jgi:hypothetical protein
MFSRKIKFLVLLFVSLGFVVAWSFRPQQKYYLSVCAIFRNEARFLPEWIEYHKLHGVEHFYLLNNLSEDDYQSALKPYIDEGLVELYQWPHHGKNQREWNTIQCSAYKKLLRDKKRETFWMAIIDTDEFLVPVQTDDLKNFLKPYEPYGGVTINWQLFGTSNVEKILQGKSLIGALTHRAPSDHPRNLFVKSIVQPRKVRKIAEPHYCHYIKPYFHVTENFERMPSVSLSTKVSIDKIRLHHYTNRDELFLRTEKLKRFKEWNPNEMIVYPSYNDVEDTTLQAQAPLVEKQLTVR